MGMPRFEFDQSGPQAFREGIIGLVGNGPGCAMLQQMLDIAGNGLQHRLSRCVDLAGTGKLRVQD